MSPGVVFERVYLALKEELGSGRIAGGTPLEPAHLSQDLNASITPVRDALHRLVGEGLVEAPRSDGFRTPLVTEHGLRQLYRWHGTLLDLATRAPPSSLSPASPAQTDGADLVLLRTEMLFIAIGARAGNADHLAAIARAGERLRPVRRIELQIIADTGAELDGIAARLGAGQGAPLRQAIVRYHRRRERLAPDIVAALHAIC